MEKENLDKEIDDLAFEHANSFTRLSEIEGIIVRGHILVEHALNRAIKLTVVNSSAYKPERFTFSHKVLLAQMLGILDPFFEEINALNKLRNQIAHSLKFDEKYLDIIIKGVLQKDKSLDKVDDKSQQLRMCISFMCGAISLLYRHAKVKAALSTFANSKAQNGSGK